MVQDKNERGIPDDLEEELRVVGEIYADRLSNPGNPLGGEELHKETMKKLKILIESGFLEETKASEETQAVVEAYGDRFKRDRNPLSGEELRESAINKFNKIIENEKEKGTL